MSLTYMSEGFQEGLSAKDLTNAELTKSVQFLRKEKTILAMENLVLENFLERNDPKSLEGMQKIMEKADKIQQTQSMCYSPSMNNFSNIRISVATTHNHTPSFSMSSNISTGSTSGRNRRINIQAKTELVNKELELFDKGMAQFRKTSKIRRCNLKNELEEINLRLSETKDAREVFEQTIIKDGVNAITGRIPAEKFIRYMEEWLKSAETIIGRLRIRTKTTRYKFIHLLNVLESKKELGEILRPVDFDILNIEHTEFVKQLEEKNNDLIITKQDTGYANLMLSQCKLSLVQKTKALNEIKKTLAEKQESAEQLRNEIEVVEAEIERSIEDLEKIRYYTENYSVPSIREYMNKKTEYDYLNDAIKVWRRKNKIQQTSLNTCIKEMKRLTGKKTESDSWFQIEETERDPYADDGF